MRGSFLLFLFLFLFCFGGVVVVGKLSNCLHYPVVPRLGEHVRIDEETEGFAVIIQPLMSTSLPFVLHRFISYLPPTYKVILITENNNLRNKLNLLDPVMASLNISSYYLPSSPYPDTHRPISSSDPPFLSFTSLPSLEHKFYVLPLLPDNFTIPRYSCFLIHDEFYNNIPVEHLLIFQSDTILLRKDDGGTDLPPYRRKYLRDFYRYAYVGAPWNWRKCQDLPGHRDHRCRDGGNGGFSYRNVKKMREITNSDEFLGRLNLAIHGCSAEDIILAGYMTNNESLREFLPPREEAVLFSQETIRSQDLPLGIHKVWAYDRGFYNQQPDIQKLKLLHKGKRADLLLKWGHEIQMSEEIYAPFERWLKAWFGDQIKIQRGLERMEERRRKLEIEEFRKEKEEK